MKINKIAGKVCAQRRTGVQALALLLVFGVPLEAAARTAWAPAPGPLKTRWAKDVNPDHPLPEYPRPQLVRADWLNLNGLWNMGIGAKGADAPVTFTNKILV